MKTTFKIYIEHRMAEGANLSAIARETAAICAASERTVWRWIGGSPVPPWATRLLTIWHACQPDQRTSWFS